MSGPRFEPGASRIEGRLGEGWVVAGRLYRPAALVTAEIAATLPRLLLETLDAADLPEMPGIELLLLGTGASMVRPRLAFVHAARERGWRVEPMDSPAAARTFNVLVAEDRPVAALLL